MIASPQFLSLVRFEVVRLVRARATALGLGLFVLAQATVRALTHLGQFNSANGDFRLIYFLALIPVLRFGLLEDRAASFDEALTANGVPPLKYVTAKLAAVALTLAVFTATCAAVTVLVGGIPAVIVVWAAAHGLLVAWLFAPGAFLVESVSEIRMPMAVVYILVVVAMLVFYGSSLVLETVNLTGLFGRSGRDLTRLLITDAVVATPVLALVAWLAVARRLAPLPARARTGNEV